LSGITSEELEIRIRKWLEQNKKVSITNIHEEKSYFVLKFKISEKPYFPTINIRHSKIKPDALVIGWSWGFLDKDIIMISKIDEKIKTKLQKKIIEGFLLMNLPIKLIPSIHNLQKITCFKLLHLDGLSEGRFIDIVDKVSKAYTFTYLKFDEYLKFPKKFNPDDLI
jgi:hypothetical protein